MKRLFWFALMIVSAVLVLGSSCPTPTPGPGPTVVTAPDPGPVHVEGSYQVSSVGLCSDTGFGGNLVLHNTSDQPMDVTSARMFFATQGGWVLGGGQLWGSGGPWHDEAARGALPAHYTGGPWGNGWSYSSSVTHVLVAFETKDGGHFMSQVPVASNPHPTLDFDGGYPAAPLAPSPLVWATAPVFIGVVSPVHILRVTEPLPPQGATVLPNGQWLWLIGQVVKTNSDSTPTNISAWHLVLKAAGSGRTVLDVQDAPELDRTHIDGTYTPFMYSLKLKDDEPVFYEGTLLLDVTYQLDGSTKTAHYEAPVTQASPPRIRSPLDVPSGHLTDGTINYGSGPANGFTTHSNEWERYAYDIGLRVGGQNLKPGTTGKSNNSDFWSFGLPVLAMRDGVVVKADDSQRDNPGYNQGPCPWTVDGGTPGQPCPSAGNGVVILAHTTSTGAYDGTFSVYAHIEQGSIDHTRIHPGAAVKQSDVLGRLGNSGGSSEPHLHFAYCAYDRTGRPELQPMNFLNLRSSNRFVTGTPQNGLQVVSTPSWPSWP